MYEKNRKALGDLFSGGKRFINYREKLAVSKQEKRYKTEKKKREEDEMYK